MEPRMGEINSRRNALLEAGRPTTDFVLTFLRPTIDHSKDPSNSQTTPPFYRNFNKQIDLELESWLELRQGGDA